MMHRPGPRRLAPLLALLLLGTAALAAVPTAQAHFCSTRIQHHQDPAGCNAHDCQSGRELHGHIVWHDTGDNAAVHGCGVLLHVAADGDGSISVCISSTVCIDVSRPEWTDGASLP